MVYDEPPFSATRDLSREWRSCCLAAGGWDEELLDFPSVDGDDDETKRPAAVSLISLVDYNGNITNADDDADVAESNDGWIVAVREIEQNMNRMIEWLQEKQWMYTSVETPDQEASLIQSTIASYTASTANELEEFRNVLLTKQQVEYRHRPQQFEHHNVMVQTLLQRLKREIAEPFGKLQKQRQREAVKLWQNPLRVELYVPPPVVVEPDEMDAALGIAATQDDRRPNQNFVPQRPRLPLQSNFMNSYQVVNNSNGELSKPESLFSKRDKRGSGSPSAGNDDDSSNPIPPPQTRPKQGPLEKRPKPNQPPTRNPQAPQPHHHQQPYNPPPPPKDDLQYAEPQDLQQEAVLLKASLENDLDQVQKMETTMVNITKLLSEFADLVAGQQEDILHIHDAAETSKENVQKGQEKLLDAADRTQQSKHYMASAITAMGVMLLVVHWIRP